VTYGVSTLLDKEARAVNRVRAAWGASLVRAFFESRVALLQRLAASEPLQSAMREGDRSAVEEALARAFLEQAMALDLRGDVIGAIPPREGHFSLQSWFSEAQQAEKPVITGVITDPHDKGRSVAMVVVSIRNAQGERIGLLAACYAVDHLLLHAQSARVMLVDAYGHPLLRGDKQGYFFLDQQPSEESGVFEAGGTTLVAYHREEESGWAALATQPLADVYAPLRALVRELALAGGVAALFLLLFAFYWTRTVRRFHQGRLLEEDARLQRAQEKVRAEVELEQLDLFSFATTHDLQEPIHKVVAFSEFLTKASGLDLSAQERDHYLQLIRSESAKASTLIRRVAELSTIMKEGKEFELFDPNALVASTVESFQEALQQCGGSVSVEPLPPLRGDKQQIADLFQTLIDNAVKFRRADVPLIVLIQGRERGDEGVEIVVRDNGVGFDEQHLAQLFKPFRRLHPYAEYPGAGLGLAICKKIMERHGGTITARSSPGGGAAFILRFPRSAR
jgi:signal transduction histidine kinase